MRMKETETTECILCENSNSLVFLFCFLHKERHFAVYIHFTVYIHRRVYEKFEELTIDK